MKDIHRSNKFVTKVYCSKQLLLKVMKDLQLQMTANIKQKQAWLLPKIVVRPIGTIITQVSLTLLVLSSIY